MDDVTDAEWAVIMAAREAQEEEDLRLYGDTPSPIMFDDVPF